MKLKDWIKKYNHAFVLLYIFIYMPWFTYLEKTVTTNFKLVTSPLDQYIPFVEIFIIPYLLWFVLMAAGWIFLFFKDKKEFLKMACLLFTGMTIFLIICTIYPNGLALRPTEFPRENIFTDLVRYVYAHDTPTNVFPSMHVFDSLGLCIALLRTECLKGKTKTRIGIILTTTSIVLSTMFLKQHSFTDVIAGFILAGILYQLVYAGEKKRSHELSELFITW